jgi:hypothetical protein
MGPLAVLVRGLGVLLGRFVLAHLVVVGRLKVVMGGGRMVGGGLVMVLGRGVHGACRHRSILLSDNGTEQNQRIMLLHIFA